MLALLAGTAAADNKTEVFFRFDSAELSDTAKEALAKAADEAMQTPSAKLVIDGHADSRGMSPYNVGLSIRRAEAVRKALVARGVDPDNIVLAFYGEDGPRRATFAEDRRVGVELTDRPLYSIIDRALPVATALTWGKPATVAEIEGPRADQTARR